MESNLSNSLKLIDFSIAIINNDIEVVKEFVEYFNSQDPDIYNDGFNLFDISAKNNNEAFTYVLENLNNYPQIEKLRWEIGVGKLVINRDRNLLTDEDLINTINNTLENEFEEYKCTGLIRLANVAHHYESLISIKNKINGVIEETTTEEEEVVEQTVTDDETIIEEVVDEELMENNSITEEEV